MGGVCRDSQVHASPVTAALSVSAGVNLNLFRDAGWPGEDGAPAPPAAPPPPAAKRRLHVGEVPPAISQDPSRATGPLPRRIHPLPSSAFRPDVAGRPGPRFRPLSRGRRRARTPRALAIRPLHGTTRRPVPAAAQTVPPVYAPSSDAAGDRTPAEPGQGPAMGQPATEIELPFEDPW